jgi:hypothetical protein
MSWIIPVGDPLTGFYSLQYAGPEISGMGIFRTPVSRSQTLLVALAATDWQYIRIRSAVVVIKVMDFPAALV